MSASSSSHGLQPPRAPNGSHNDAPSRLSLPTFAPINLHRSQSRDTEKTESSASGSRRSGSTGRAHRSRDRAQAAEEQIMTPKKEELSPRIETKIAHPAGGSDGQAALSHNHGSVSRRTSKRSSGGFLLGSIGRSSRMSRMFQKSGDQDSMDRKGKSKSTTTTDSRSEDIAPVQPYLTPVAKLRHSESRPSSSIGSSPLSVEVTNEDIGYKTNGTTPAQPPHQPSDSRRSGSFDIALPNIEIGKRPTTSVGYDTDPAQIVNMALTLSEARRRQASERRHVSAAQSRTVSGPPAETIRRNSQRVGSVAQYLHAQRTPSVKSNAVTPQLNPAHAVPTANATMLDDDDDMDVDEWDHDISAATKARVEKARTFFELAYEHRRLLSHLPPVRRPGTAVRSESPGSQSKVYNPLQYVRNRKLRLWSKCAIDGEAEGWHDIDKVRSWVNAVIEGHAETRHEADECIRLPPLVEHQNNESSRDTSLSASLSTSKDRYLSKHHQDTTARPRRPRSDFLFHPGDLLADCFWLEQGLNKSRILDRENNNIYPPNTQFKFSGWRSGAPAHLPEGLQQPSPPESADEEHTRHESLHPVSELPTFKSAHQKTLHRRKRTKVRDSIAAADEGGLSRGLKVLMDDSTSSGSDASSGGQSPGAERGRRRLRKRHKQNMDVSPGQIPTSSNFQNLHDTTASDQSAPSSRQASKRASIDIGPSRMGRFLKRESASKTRNSRSLTRADQRPYETDKFPGVEQHPRMSADYDTTAPSSPAHPTWPSIAINLESPPQSRASSPSKRRGHVSAILNPIHRHHKHESISAMDFGAVSKRSSGVAPNDDEKAKQDSTDVSRGTSPMTRGQSPMTKRDSNVPAGVIVEQQPMSRYTTKSSFPSSEHSKRRGIFKGGRIAELVGHEVSKVGDYIWKKDPPVAYVDSVRSGYESDSESEPLNGTVLKTPPANLVRSRSSTISSTKSDSPNLSNKSPPDSNGRPKYNNPNLPSFTSPFDKDKEVQDRKMALLTPTASNGDHISRQAADHRSTSRSPRLDRLAPPKLNTGDRSSSLSRLTPATSHQSGLGLTLTRSQEATNKLNTALGDRAQRLASGVDLARIGSHDLAESPYVTFRDISRATAFIYTSTVKAREISRQADAPRPQRPEYWTEAMSGFKVPDAHIRADLALVARREEKIVAARRIMEALTEEASQFEDTLRNFSTKTAPSLHRRLQEIEDMVENKMTPRVRSSADEAGELSIRLATTSTLAVQGVNEVIDAALLRRTRGPVRWIRGAWYRFVELFVVGLLWAIWAVVSIIRAFLAMFTGTVRGVKWLLWSR